MMTIFLPLIFFLSILFMQLTHPLSAGIVLLLQTTLIALASGLITNSFWFSYVLFLIFLGGMLVLFIYVASLASNEAFKMSLLSTATIIISTFMVTFALIFLDPLIIPSTTFLNMVTSFSNNQLISTPFLIYQIYNFPATFMTLFVILYLLLTLIVVVKITAVSFGPVRFSK